MKGCENSGQRKKQAAEFSEKNGQRKTAKFSEKKNGQRKAAEFSEKKTGSGILKSDVKEDGSSKGIDYSHPCYSTEMPKLINPSLAAAFCAAFLDVPVPCAMIASSRLHVAFQRGVVRVPGPDSLEYFHSTILRDC